MEGDPKDSDEFLEKPKTIILYGVLIARKLNLDGNKPSPDGNTPSPDGNKPHRDGNNTFSDGIKAAKATK